jgi:hypothetical protein
VAVLVSNERLAPAFTCLSFGPKFRESRASVRFG